MSREARLLLVTILVSAALLWVLARYRFPADGRPAAPVAVAPLERLAARATFDELASIIAGLDPAIERAIVVLRVAGGRETKAGQLPAGADLPRFVPALRIRDDAAVVALEPDATILGVVGDPDATPHILGIDRVRDVVTVRVPPRPAPTLSVVTAAEFRGPARYVVVVEGTTGGPAARPLFLSRTDPVTDPRWAAPLLAMGGAPTAGAGSWVFGLDGRLVGLVIRDEGQPALVFAASILEQAEPLVNGQSVPEGDLGVAVQPLTTGVAALSRAAHGVVVVGVDEAGPAAKLLTVGDVVAAMNGAPVYTSEAFQQHVVSLRPGAGATLDILRSGQSSRVELKARAKPADAAPAATDVLGLALRTEARRGARVVRVSPGSAADRAGLLGGDLITHLGETPAPASAAVVKAYEGLAPAGALLLGVTRGDGRLVLVVSRP